MHSIPPSNTALIHLTAVHTYLAYSRYGDSRSCSSFNSYWKKKAFAPALNFQFIWGRYYSLKKTSFEYGIITYIILCDGNLSWLTLRHNPLICMERVKESQQTVRADSVPTAFERVVSRIQVRSVNNLIFLARVWIVRACFRKINLWLISFTSVKLRLSSFLGFLFLPLP